jgi:hypothetical protein
VADLGGTVVGFTRTATHSTWANVVRDSGDAATTVAVNAVATSPEGRWETQVGYTDVHDQATLVARASADAARLAVRRAALNLDLRPGVLHSAADLPMGSQIQVALRSGRLVVTGTQTVQQLTVAVDDDGVSHPKLGLLQ